MILIKNKEYDALDQLFTWQVYLYCAFWILLTIGGIAVQCHFTKTMERRTFTGEKIKEDKEEHFN